MSDKNSKLWMKLGFVLAILGLVLVSGCVKRYPEHGNITKEEITLHFYVFNEYRYTARIRVDVDNNIIFSEDVKGKSEQIVTPFFRTAETNVTKGTHTIFAYESITQVNILKTVEVIREEYLIFFFEGDKFVVEVKDRKPMFL